MLPDADAGVGGAEVDADRRAVSFSGHDLVDRKRICGIGWLDLGSERACRNGTGVRGGEAIGGWILKAVVPRPRRGSRKFLGWLEAVGCDLDVQDEAARWGDGRVVAEFDSARVRGVWVLDSGVRANVLETREVEAFLPFVSGFCPIWLASIG
jgi:hypothetical protein